MLYIHVCVSIMGDIYANLYGAGGEHKSSISHNALKGTTFAHITP